jgi:hypothetical protein
LGDRAASHAVGHALGAKSQRVRAEGAES